MQAQVYRVEGRFPGHIALVPRPRGGDWLEDEVQVWSQAGLDVIVSLLTDEENADFELTQEADLCRAKGLLFYSLPVTDRSVPASKPDALNLLTRLEQLLAEGKNIGIHCRQSIGRAALLAAALMTLFGVEPNEAFQRLSAARGLPVPETPEQQKWVADLNLELTAMSHR
jgi:protein-tyrosine phosphatase